MKEWTPHSSSEVLLADWLTATTSLHDFSRDAQTYQDKNWTLWHHHLLIQAVLFTAQSPVCFLWPPRALSRSDIIPCQLPCPLWSCRTPHSTRSTPGPSLPQSREMAVKDQGQERKILRKVKLEPLDPKRKEQGWAVTVQHDLAEEHFVLFQCAPVIFI